MIEEYDSKEVIDIFLMSEELQHHLIMQHTSPFETCELCKSLNPPVAQPVEAVASSTTQFEFESQQEDKIECPTCGYPELLLIQIITTVESTRIKAIKSYLNGVYLTAAGPSLHNEPPVVKDSKMECPICDFCVSIDDNIQVEWYE